MNHRCEKNNKSGSAIIKEQNMESITKIKNNDLLEQLKYKNEL